MNEKNRLLRIKSSLKLISKYAEYIIDSRTSMSMNLIALVNLLFLPITVIVGYYGMNFNSMGVIKGTKGIFSIIHAQRFVLSLCIISMIIMGLLFKMIQLPGWGH